MGRMYGYSMISAKKCTSKRLIRQNRIFTGLKLIPEKEKI